ncbi:MAG: T9SS type A sorting domain-containing protein, partial [Spirosomaceae bacterium]|nr:T9SS type A sorting domain-containing protein [Spirosomataceae bacterium]
PNPIRPEFEGVFTVKGLSFDSKIKITTPDGRVVSTTFSNGGIASWDLRTPNGDKAPSGVYFVFVLNSDFTEKFVGKVAVVR